jgi:hypothetical protein
MKRKKGAPIQPPNGEEVLRRVAIDWLAFNEREFQATGNPIAAWDAVADCLSAKIPFPDWLNQYLWRCALNVSGMWRADSVPTGARLNAAVAKAFGLQGRARFNPLIAPHRPGHDFGIAMDVYHAHYHLTKALEPGQVFKWDAAYEVVAKKHSAQNPRCLVCSRGKISPSHVRRIWSKQAEVVIPASVIERGKALGAQTLDEILRITMP